MAILILCNSRLDISTVRLFGNTKKYEGKVEVYDGEWKTVCDPSWDIDAATVVCRQLGYNRASSATWNQMAYSWTPTKIWKDDVRCRGIENNLKQCSFARWGHNEDEVCPLWKTAGVSCGKSMLSPIIDTTYFSTTQT